jgi:hypothetical protein
MNRDERMVSSPWRSEFGLIVGVVAATVVFVLSLPEVADDRP